MNGARAFFPASGGFPMGNCGQKKRLGQSRTWGSMRLAQSTALLGAQHQAATGVLLHLVAGEGHRLGASLPPEGDQVGIVLAGYVARLPAGDDNAALSVLAEKAHPFGNACQKQCVGRFSSRLPPIIARETIISTRCLTGVRAEYPHPFWNYVRCSTFSRSRSDLRRALQSSTIGIIAGIRCAFLPRLCRHVARLLALRQPQTCQPTTALVRSVADSHASGSLHSPSAWKRSCRNKPTANCWPEVASASPSTRTCFAVMPWRQISTAV